jgi:hypothetical protein
MNEPPTWVEPGKTNAPFSRPGFNWKKWSPGLQGRKIKWVVVDFFPKPETTLDGKFSPTFSLNAITPLEWTIPHYSGIHDGNFYELLR